MQIQTLVQHCMWLGRFSHMALDTFRTPQTVLTPQKVTATYLYPVYDSWRPQMFPFEESNELLQCWEPEDFLYTLNFYYKWVKVCTSMQMQIFSEHRALGFSWQGMCLCMHRILISRDFITTISYCAIAVARGTDLFSNALGFVLYIK